MEKISVADARKAEAVGKQVWLQGWVRTRRDSKGGFSFIELNDGSCQGNVQVVAPGELPNYEAVVKHLHTGASVSIEGEVKASPAKGQATEVLASGVQLLGDADAESYPLQKKGHSLEFLREIAHLRPRTNTFGAVDAIAASGIDVDSPVLPRTRLLLHSHADHHRERLRRGRGTVSRHDARPRRGYQKPRRQDRLHQGLLRQAGVPHRERAASGRNVRLCSGQDLHLRPDLPRRELEHSAPPRRVLDDRTGNGLLRTHRQHGPGRSISSSGSSPTR